MISAAEHPTVTARPGSCFNCSGELKGFSATGAVARVSHRLRGRRASVRREILPVVTSEDIALDRKPREEFEFSGNKRTEVATDRVDFSPGGGYVSGDYGLADRSNGFFSVVKRRLLTTLPSLLSDSINCLQKLKGTGDTVRKQVQAVDEPVEGLRERLAADPTEGEQTGSSPE